ncbi:hypothetical protein ACLGDJ_05735 [Helicobacter pylori]
MILSVENTNTTQGDKRPIYAELDIAFSDGKISMLQNARVGS